LSIAATVHERVHRHLVFDRRRDRLVAALAAVLPDQCRVLDVGCGNGEIGMTLTSAERAVSGVETLERASCQIPLRLYDGVELPFDDATFDWAIIVDVLHHAANPAQVIAEAMRVAPKGLIIKDHYAESARQRITLGMMDWVGNRQFGVGRDGAYLSRDDWATLWGSSGLVVTDLNEALDLYPGVAKPFFEKGLHFVARLEQR
jgi:SAM-dependent methyltransferase